MSAYRIALLTLCAWLGGCRGDAGVDDYASQERFADAAPPPIDANLEEGESRFSLGVFYEGPADEIVVIDGVNAHFYIYEGTFSVSADEGDRVEGAQSDRLSLSAGAWWGGGVHWARPRDLSGWPTLRLSLKSGDASLEALEIAMSDPDDDQAALPVADYGFAADGAWHDLEIPLADFEEAGLDLTRVASPFIFIGGASARGELLHVDAVYLTSLDPE